MNLIEYSRTSSNTEKYPDSPRRAWCCPTQPTHGCFTTKKEKKALGTIGEGGQATVSSQSPPLLALSIALTCFSVAFWVTKGSQLGLVGWVGGSGGSLASTRALSRFPSFLFFFSSQWLKWSETSGAGLKSVRVTWPDINWQHER